MEWLLSRRVPAVCTVWPWGSVETATMDYGPSSAGTSKVRKPATIATAMVCLLADNAPCRDTVRYARLQRLPPGEGLAIHSSVFLLLVPSCLRRTQRLDTRASGAECLLQAALR